MWRLEKRTAPNSENQEQSNEVIGTTIYNEPDPAYYSEPHFPARKLPSLPVVSRTDGPTDRHDIAIKMTSGVISNESKSYPEISSDLSPCSEIETPYSRLDSSTLPPPLSPVSYESLVRPVYANANFAAGEMTNGISCDEEPSDSGVLKLRSISTSSGTETTML